MALSETLLNAATNGIKGAFSHVGLLQDSTELTGGSPAYARKAISYGSPSGGDVTATVTFDVPAGSTVNQVGFYTASSGGAPVHTEVVEAEIFAAQGTYELTVPIDVD